MIHWNVDPEIITLFGTLPIRYYGLLIVLGIFLSYRTAKRIYFSEKIPAEHLEKLATYLFVGVLLGMRLGHCLFYDFEYYSNHILEIFIPFQKINGNWNFTGFRGLASHGGTIGAILGVIFYARKYKTSLLWVLDRMNYGVVFMRDDMIARHPTQLYEAFSYILIFTVLWYMYRKTNVYEKKGVLFGVLLSTLFTTRFIIEFFKENQVAFEDTMTLNMGQWLSIPFVLFGILAITYHIWKNRITI